MNLMLFFNGWGMDESIFKNFPPVDNLNVIVISYPYEIPKLDFDTYNHIYIVGWSFGVYYASKFLKTKQLKSYTAIAINGTPEIIGTNGITEKIFNLTLNNLDLENLYKFYSNMEVPNNFIAPNININILKNSLQELKDDYHLLDNPFQIAIIGIRDKIIPTSRQVKYFTSKHVHIKSIECGHYPFEILNDWNKLIKDN